MELLNEHIDVVSNICGMYIFVPIATLLFASLPGILVAEAIDELHWPRSHCTLAWIPAGIVAEIAVSGMLAYAYVESFYVMFSFVAVIGAGMSAAAMLVLKICGVFAD